MASLKLHNPYEAEYKCSVYIRNRPYQPYPLLENWDANCQKWFTFELHPTSNDSNPGSYLSIEMAINTDTNIVSNIKVEVDTIFPLGESKYNRSICKASYNTIYDLAEWLDGVVCYHPFQSTIGTTKYIYYDCNNNYDDATEYAKPIMTKLICDINNAPTYTLK